jgi:hypothetical protein
MDELDKLKARAAYLDDLACTTPNKEAREQCIQLAAALREYASTLKGVRFADPREAVKARATARTRITAIVMPVLSAVPKRTYVELTTWDPFELTYPTCYDCLDNGTPLEVIACFQCKRYDKDPSANPRSLAQVEAEFVFTNHTRY